ncbi:peptidoglycan-binding protein [Streptomyces sp. NPDC006285]|uniref:peptidoglycan-binding protein n=1 Tax=Streptomyces sp. NPDC006285 TaxID=3364742 RepID=UPI003692256A
MRTFRRPGATLMALALVAIVTPVASVALAAPATAAVSCTGTSWIYKGDTWYVLPSVNPDDGNVNCVMGVGNQSRAVGWLQSTLVACYGENLAIDDVYGSRTAAAVRRAQQAHG